MQFRWIFVAVGVLLLAGVLAALLLNDSIRGEVMQFFFGPEKNAVLLVPFSCVVVIIPIVFMRLLRKESRHPSKDLKG